MRAGRCVYVCERMHVCLATRPVCALHRLEGIEKEREPSSEAGPLVGLLCRQASVSCSSSDSPAAFFARRLAAASGRLGSCK